MRARVGTGFDIHKLAPGRPLLLGGIEIPHSKGLVGHSDGDVLLHAITDALLGAAGLGNIGERFPDTDPALAGADSASFLREAVRLVRQKGFEIGNLDSNVLAEDPRLLPFLARMMGNIASILRVDSDQVQVKAKTMEGIGPIGRGEAIAAQVVALIYPA